MGRAKKRTMRSVKKNGFTGVYVRLYGGKVTGYTSFVADTNVKGGRRQLRTWPTAQEAREEREAELQKGPRRAGRKTLREYFDDTYAPTHLQRQKPGSIQSTTFALKNFLRQFGSQRMDRLDEAAVRAWGLRAPLGQAKAARAFLYHAKDNRFLRENPLARLGRSESKGRANISIISDEDLYGLADTALDIFGADYGPVFRARIIFGAYTCLRPAEVCPLLKSNVFRDYVRVRDNISGGVLVDSPKTGAWRNKSPLPPPARAALDAMPRSDASPYLFWGRRGGRLTKATEHLYWDNVRKAYAAKTGDPRWNGFDLYELRHRGASFMLNDLELPAELVAWALGHTGQTGVDLVIRLYGHPDEDRWHRRVMNAFEAHEERQQAERDKAAGVPRLRVVGDE